MTIRGLAEFSLFREEKTWGDLITALRDLEVVTEKMGDAQWQDNSQQAQVVAEEIPSEYKKNAPECS